MPVILKDIDDAADSAMARPDNVELIDRFLALHPGADRAVCLDVMRNLVKVRLRLRLEMEAQIFKACGIPAYIVFQD